MKHIVTFFKRYWITFVIFAGLVGFYSLYASGEGANSYLFPSVEKIGAAFVADKGLMFSNVVSSFRLMLPAMIISLVVALALGTLVGLHPMLRRVLYPVIYAFSAVPSILLSPFALMIAPTFNAASIFLIVYGTIWATLFATITGIMTIDKRYLEKAAVLELSGVRKLVKVILPAASPAILAGFVNSLRSTFIMLVYAEMYGSQNGMGYYVKKYAEFGMYDRTWSGLIFMVIVLIIVMQLFEQVKNYILRWTI